MVEAAKRTSTLKRRWEGLLVQTEAAGYSPLGLGPFCGFSVPLHESLSRSACASLALLLRFSSAPCEILIMGTRRAHIHSTDPSAQNLDDS
jgi:hypothetical protein